MSDVADMISALSAEIQSLKRQLVEKDWMIVERNDLVAERNRLLLAMGAESFEQGLSWVSSLGGALGRAEQKILAVEKVLTADRDEWQQTPCDLRGGLVEVQADERPDKVQWRVKHLNGEATRFESREYASAFAGDSTDHIVQSRSVSPWRTVSHERLGFE